MITDRYFDAEKSALKLYLEDICTIDTPSSFGYTGSFVIPHGYPNDELIWQVNVQQGLNRYTLPIFSNDGRLQIYSRLDSTNLTIYVTVSSSGTPFPASTWNFRYRILIP